jgi:hypothetical protein
VVRALVLVEFLSSLRFESPWVKTILWSQPAGEVKVLLDLSGGSVLHRSEVYLTCVGTQSSSALKGFPVIKKIK